MLRKNRRIYFWILFATALFIIFAVMFFISGYRINFWDRQISTTGSIFLKTEPKKAEVVLNDKLYKKTTPILINNLAPKKYNIKLDYPDRFNWEKTLDVEPQKTTIIDEVILFKETTEPEQIEKKYEREDIIAYFTPVVFKEQYSDYMFPDFQTKNRIMFYNKHEIWVWDEVEESKSLVVRLGSEIKEAIWHPSGAYIIYTESNHLRIIEVDGTDYRNSYDLLDHGVEDIEVDGDGENIYFKKDSNYWKLNIL
ncbi:PEGA domain-containing protein [Patescibacteria group bacterium]|nr:PEGA domain-containing protein [Patescibacteria group bacterium]MBU1673220.1 PEGA domain-containing protein [Patescibacteria group bacterium]MBU1964022.1 PEGA domain-containing protein [Patescibacteria group bacterium]